MKYAVISTEKARAMGIDPRLHRTSAGGTKVMVNENELLMLSKRNGGGDNLSMAKELGGEELITRKQARRRVNSWKQKND